MFLAAEPFCENRIKKLLVPCLMGSGIALAALLKRGEIHVAGISDLTDDRCGCVGTFPI